MRVLDHDDSEIVRVKIDGAWRSLTSCHEFEARAYMIELATAIETIDGKVLELTDSIT